MMNYVQFAISKPVFLTDRISIVPLCGPFTYHIPPVRVLISQIVRFKIIITKKYQKNYTHCISNLGTGVPELK